MLLRKIDNDKNMTTKTANNDTFGAFTLIFLQVIKGIQNSVVTYVPKTDSFLKSNKLFIIGFSSPNKKNISSRGFGGLG